MDKQKDVRRHASQLKVLARLLEHELDASQGKDLVLDRELSENILDTIEIFIEDIDGIGVSQAPWLGARSGEHSFHCGAGGIDRTRRNSHRSDNLDHFRPCFRSCVRKYA